MSEASNNSKKINEIAKVLRKEFKPTRIFLFGSHANGTARENSDYDFVLIVSRNRRSRLENMARARQVIHEKCGVSADVFVYSQREFNEWKLELSSIPETALNTGREIDVG